ncbi:hypothetical protein E2562_007938 [Oryza meyeriana var. granulata]|uniref:Uncharacterized protein n=1 Tax=Oryza meyeriana var. granulata TaxID=110450 RepID=A0A6G1DFE1_9ORYZ|nr:hypothetical protein E2562_007938 [Oryza meyeriana var. granulata]
MVDEYYYYSYGGAGPASWAGVLSSILEEESFKEGTPADAAATLRKADAATTLRKAAETLKLMWPSRARKP